ncbi:MAG: hypothetical protein H8E45_00150 [Proteobacteria bacterium]|nr:hypothetical protein [Pseudomonadota bacterium]
MASSPPADPVPSEPVGGKRWQTLLAAALFLLCLAYTLLGVWTQGPTNAVPAVTRPDVTTRWKTLVENDVRFGAWGSSRNAWALTHEPWNLFDAEPCYPATNTLAFGNPMISLGVLGAPVRLLVSDPVLTYNVVVALVMMSSALAMFLLVRQWTGEPAAALAAGIMFAFHPVALKGLHHLFTYDLSWIVWALFFGYRLFHNGRFSDALLLAMALVMQMGGSYYGALAGLIVGIPMGAWTVWCHRDRRFPTVRLGLALALVIIGGVLIYLPFVNTGAELDSRVGLQNFAAWGDFLPGGPRFTGWWMLLLVAAAFAPLPSGLKNLARWAGNPRWALLAAALMVTIVTTGGATDLANLLPGFENIRVPLFLSRGTHLALSALAGLGAAVLLALAPAERKKPAGVILVLATLVCTLIFPLPGSELPAIYALELRPDNAELELFDALERHGNHGPLLELPHRDGDLTPHAKSLLLTSFHHRRTSACYNSYAPPELEQVSSIARDMPSPSALSAARHLGFTTILLRHPGDDQKTTALLERMKKVSENPSSGLRLLHSGESLSAFTLSAND